MKLYSHTSTRHTNSGSDVTDARVKFFSSQTYGGFYFRGGGPSLHMAPGLHSGRDEMVRNARRKGSTHNGRRANGDLGLPRKGESADAPTRFRSCLGWSVHTFPLDFSALAADLDEFDLTIGRCELTCATFPPCGERPGRLRPMQIPRKRKFPRKSRAVRLRPWTCAHL